MTKKTKFTTLLIVQIGVMAALVYVVTLFRFPLFGSKVHFANALCLISGLLLGPIPGGLAAGLGSALYDATLGGYDVANILLTFVSKFLMAFICAKIAYARNANTDNRVQDIAASVIGALSYVALYMLKTFIYQAFVYGYPMATVGATMLSKLIPSLINALVAMVAAPIVFLALRPAMKKLHVGAMAAKA